MVCRSLAAGGPVSPAPALGAVGAPGTPAAVYRLKSLVAQAPAPPLPLQHRSSRLVNRAFSLHSCVRKQQVREALSDPRPACPATHLRGGA